MPDRVAMTPGGASPDAVQAAAMMAPLHEVIRSGVDAERAAVLLGGLEARLRQILHEHEGMAAELLRIYEHVSVVFDLTPRLMTVRDEGEVLAVLVESLSLVFPKDAIAVVTTSDKDGSWEAQGLSTGPGTDEWPAWIGAALEGARRERRVGVVRPNQDVDVTLDGTVLRAEQAMVAPVIAGDDFVCALVLRRSAGATGWDSGQSMLLDSLARFCGDVIRNFRLLDQLQQMSMDLVRTLIAAVDQKDPYTSGHSNRVGYYAMLLGRALNLNGSQLRILEWSALLHDVGKIGIRDAVLKKPGKLTAEEFEHIKEHPVRGFEVMRGNPHMREALDGIRHHHERYDGTGYPDGLTGKAIPLQARIIQIADIFDALTTNRAYRGAFPWRKALEILQEEAGTVVDPDLCSTFVALLDSLHERNPKAFEAIGQAVDELRLAEAARGNADKLKS